MRQAGYMSRRCTRGPSLLLKWGPWKHLEGATAAHWNSNWDQQHAQNCQTDWDIYPEPKQTAGSCCEDQELWDYSDRLVCWRSNSWFCFLHKRDASAVLNWSKWWRHPPSLLICCPEGLDAWGYWQTERCCSLMRVPTCCHLVKENLNLVEEQGSLNLSESFLLDIIISGWEVD